MRERERENKRGVLGFVGRESVLHTNRIAYPWERKELDFYSAFIVQLSACLDTSTAMLVGRRLTQTCPEGMLVASPSHPQRLNPSMRVADETLCVCYPLNRTCLGNWQTSTELPRRDADRTWYEATVRWWHYPKFSQKWDMIVYPLTSIYSKLCIHVLFFHSGPRPVFFIFCSLDALRSIWWPLLHCGTRFLLIHVDYSNSISILQYSMLVEHKIHQFLYGGKSSIPMCEPLFMFCSCPLLKFSLYAWKHRKQKLYWFLCLFFEIKMNDVVQRFFSIVKSQLERPLDSNS